MRCRPSHRTSSRSDIPKEPESSFCRVVVAKRGLSSAGESLDRSKRGKLYPFKIIRLSLYVKAG
jgi:hypothetical protein